MGVLGICCVVLVVVAVVVVDAGVCLVWMLGAMGVVDVDPIGY